MNQEHAIELNGICKSYSDFTLDHLTFHLPKGCIMGLIGENGSGKSTTIKAILNLIHIEEGTIRILDQNHTIEDKILKSKIGIVFDENSYYNSFKIHEISTIFASLYPTWDSVCFQKYIVRFQLPHQKKIADFSKGMRMKTAIAIALSHNAQILILDEATSGLDPIARDEILEILQEFIQDEAHSVLISSHIVSDLEKIADYITFIHKGTLLFSESKDELLDQYGIIKCSKEVYDSLPKDHILRTRTNQFGIEALTNKRNYYTTQSDHFMMDHASIESIMIFYVKGEAV